MSDEFSATPEAFVGAFGLIRSQDGETIRYLCVLDEGRLDFVRAVRPPGGSYRDSLDAEIANRLNIRRGKDYVLSSVPRAHLNTRLCGSLVDGRQDEPVWYVCQFFVANLFGSAGRTAIGLRDDVRWLSPRDVYRGHGPDGTPLKSDLRELLKSADAVPADELV